MNIAILIALLIVTFFSFWRDKNQFEKFKTLDDTKDRNRFFKAWTIEPFILYGISSLVILWYLGQLNALNEMPEFLKNASESFMSSKVISESDFLSGILKGILISLAPMLLIGSIFGTFLHEYQNSKKAKNEHVDEPDHRNINALIPKNYKERIWGAILSINAGFSEEVFFRLLIPILIYSVTNSVVLAILCSTIWFGLAHFYQGFWGVVVTFLVGLLLFGIYLITQNIWVAMIIHAVIDINSLVLSPYLKERFSKESDN